MRVARLRGFARPLFFERDKQGDSMEPGTGSCETCSRWQEIKQRFRIANLLKSLTEGMESRIKAQEVKPSVAEYLKLLQIEQELEQESPKEIKVTWVEPGTITSVEK
jgi:hypothetical protein